MDELRQILIDYYGTAVFNGNPIAIINLTEIENATEVELIQLANKIGIKA